ncbi:ribosomal-processing cysteine protease Prp [Paenibacillus thermoaerophilus]|jgi:uncharacterized protein YsxB (DUF464 family)|uniref:Ribosomal processing cysteine protease Prp n=1 Tax=Paenibacillus thermoaerophilus TaxID=1215385 RepID=A0ABW2UWY0_9BACL|nr:ribosomal-processing cysteine protease Prp [Paenibacillus thermoaerophilus]TMV17290.1 ribosomal-processing cysteine protease Prp [Paenibacillus thermoaerophilus]
MIRVKLERRASDGAIVRYRVTGHAEYDVSGKDIVCAAVSAVSVGTVNAVEALTGVRLKASMRHGDLDVAIPDELPQDAADKVQLLLSSMLVMLQSIEESYGKYITINDSTIMNRRR